MSCGCAVLVGQLDGQLIIQAEVRGPATAAEQLGLTLAEQLLAQGAGEILSAVYLAAE